MKKIFECEVEGRFPSVNQKYTLSNKRTLILSKKYREFKDFLSVSFLQNRQSIMLTEEKLIKVKIKFYTAKDIDNLLKGTLDALEKTVYENDAAICELEVKKIKRKKNEEEKICVEVWEVENDIN